MHPALIETLATQRAADIRAALASPHRAAAKPGQPSPPISQRIGWTLVQIGLRLAVR
jgi:hypothetical protein